jgi:hypothetical protein
MCLAPAYARPKMSLIKAKIIEMFVEGTKDDYLSKLKEYKEALHANTVILESGPIKLQNLETVIEKGNKIVGVKEVRWR